MGCWKISLHLIGITGTVATLGLIVTPLLFFLSPMIVAVGWARWLVHAHTPVQALAGTTLEGSVTVVVFFVFGVL